MRAFVVSARLVDRFRWLEFTDAADAHRIGQREHARRANRFARFVHPVAAD